MKKMNYTTPQTMVSLLRLNYRFMVASMYNEYTSNPQLSNSNDNWESDEDSNDNSWDHLDNTHPL